MALLLLAITAAAIAPSAEAQILGRKLASQGTLASVLPLIKATQTEELLNEEKNLSPKERTKLRATADRVFEAGYERIMKTTGNAYASQLPIADLRMLVRFNDSPAAKRYRAATPNIIMATMKSMGALDFKGDVRAAFCEETKRLCAK